jgi:hypothetical protein
VDPIDRMEGDTPLHKSVRYVNKLNKEDWAGASALVELLVEAGADPRSVLCSLYWVYGGRMTGLFGARRTVLM